MSPCGKRQLSRLDAAIALAGARMKRELRGDQRRREERMYFCVNCRTWHLTSQPKAVRT